MQKAISLALLSCMLLFLFVPVGDVLAASDLPDFSGPIVPCGVTLPGQPSSGPEACGACELLQLSQNVINFFIFLAVVIAILMFVYAGFLYITAAGSPDKISRAHKIFWAVFIGFIIVLSAWLFVDFLMKTFFVNSPVAQNVGPWNEILCKGSGGSSPPQPTTTQCSDSKDNDGDGLIDLSDPGCVNANDDDEFDAPPSQPLTKNVCYEFVSLNLNPTINNNEYVQCAIGQLGCSPTPVAFKKTAFSNELECTANCKVASFSADNGGALICSDDATLTNNVPSIPINPTFVSGPPTISAKLSGIDIRNSSTSFINVVTINLGDPVQLDWVATPTADVQSCTVNGLKLSDSTIQGSATITNLPLGTQSYTFSCTSISVGGVINTVDATLNVVVTQVPTVSLKANGATNNITINQGQTVTLEWDANPSDFLTCTGTGFSTGSLQPIKGTDTVTPSLGTQTYSVLCTTSKSGNKGASVTVIVQSAPPNWCYETCTYFPFTTVCTPGLWPNQCSTSGTPWIKTGCESAASGDTRDVRNPTDPCFIQSSSAANFCTTEAIPGNPPAQQCFTTIAACEAWKVSTGNTDPCVLN